jgi:hypothetical protein
MQFGRPAHHRAQHNGKQRAHVQQYQYFADEPRQVATQRQNKRKHNLTPKIPLLNA